MLPSGPDISFVKFKSIIKEYPNGLSESDTRAKIIDPIFTECLGWKEDNIRREPHVKTGFLDYLFTLDEMPIFVLEAKKVNSTFNIPPSLNRRQYVIGGVIWNQLDVRNAIIQAQKYAINSGSKFAIISNGNQFLIFEAFRNGPWTQGYCLVFHSFEDIEDNFHLFWNILSKDGILKGSLQTYISKTRPILKFKKPFEFFHYQEISVAQNKYAGLLSPFIDRIFDEIIDDTQIEILKECYVYQKQHENVTNRLVQRFDTLPHYAEKYGIENFFETGTHAGKFQVTFEKCEKFLRQGSQEGSLILLLGGIGCGKTTFIHHFFKSFLADKKNILWFYVDFRQLLPDPNKIEEYIYQSIIEDYEKRYEHILSKELEKIGVFSPKPEFKDILQLFSILTFKEYTISLVLDNVDQHSLESPEYQERAFLISQNLTKKFRTLTILTLREESFFKSTMSGVLNAYSMITNKFHIDSPRFEEIIRKRLYYLIDLLKYDDLTISNKLNTTVRMGGFKELIHMFYQIINQSVSSKRPVGREILRFIDNMSWGDIRKGLYFFNTFLISGNTDVDEMLNKELSDKRGGYLIPFHHIIRSIVLENSKYYSMSYSQIMNIFDVNPDVTNSHLVHLRVLDYLTKRTTFYSLLGRGYTDMASLLIDAQSSNHSQEAIIDSIKKLAFYRLIEFDNQSREGYGTAEYLRITKAGIYYLERLAHRFVYLDLIWGDTPISEHECINKLRKLINLDRYEYDIDRIQKRFERTEIFLQYLLRSEEMEWKDYPQMKFSVFSNEKFIDRIIRDYKKEKRYILQRMRLRHAKYKPKSRTR